MYTFQRQIRLLKDLYKLVIIFYNSFIKVRSPRLKAEKTLNLDMKILFCKYKPYLGHI